MKLNRRFIRNKKKVPVSVVTVIILTVAITVAIAATVYVYMSGMSGEPSRRSTLLMNTYSHNDGNNTKIWLVVRAGGDALPDNSYAWALIDTNGENASTTAQQTSYTTNATCNFNEVGGYDYVNSGDAFTVVAPMDGYYVFMLTNTATGQTIFKSSSVKY